MKNLQILRINYCLVEVGKPKTGWWAQMKDSITRIINGKGVGKNKLSQIVLRLALNSIAPIEENHKNSLPILRAERSETGSWQGAAQRQFYN